MLFTGKEKRYRALILSLLMFLILLFIEVLTKKYVHFSVEKIPSFYTILGFLFAYLIIFITYLAKKIGLNKKEDYYD